MPHLNTNVTAPTASQSYSMITIHQDTVCCRHVNTDSKTTTCPFLPARFSLISGRVVGLHWKSQTEQKCTQPWYAGMFYKSIGWISHIHLGKEPKERPKVIGLPCLSIWNGLSPLHVKWGAISSSLDLHLHLAAFSSPQSVPRPTVPILIGPVVFWMSADILS